MLSLVSQQLHHKPKQNKKYFKIHYVKNKLFLKSTAANCCTVTVRKLEKSKIYREYKTLKHRLYAYNNFLNKINKRELHILKPILHSFL